MDGRHDVVIDTSTLINFLAVDRVDLLRDNPRYHFVVTEHAREEVTDHYGPQLDRLREALADGALEESGVHEIGELERFAKLAATKQLGPGECASIAAAVGRGCVLAIDDKVAAKRARQASKTLIIVDTQQIVVELIQDGMLDVATADAIKDTWERECRFKLKIASFSQLVAE